MKVNRPECFEFSMDFLGGKDAEEVRNYVEYLEGLVNMSQIEDDFKQAHRNLVNHVRNTIDDNLMVRLVDNRDAQIKYLVDLAASNRAEWSGGSHIATNVVEAIWKEEAIDRLRRLL